jgi:hypothetical protein
MTRKTLSVPLVLLRASTLIQETRDMARWHEVARLSRHVCHRGLQGRVAASREVPQKKQSEANTGQSLR